MKKSTKIFVFGGLICMAVGMVVMLITGGIGGAKIVKEVYKGLRDASITSENLGLDVYLPEDFEDLDFYAVSGSKELGISENNIHSVNITVDGGAVNIENGAEDVIVFSSKGEFNTMYTVEDGVLVVKEEIDAFSNGGEITIYLPAQMTFEEIRVNVGGGELQAELLNAKEVSVNVGAGEANIDNIIAEQLDANVGAGEIVIENSEIAQDVRVNVGVGEMEFVGMMNGNADLRCGMGELEVQVKGYAMEDYDYNVSCAAGNVDLGDMSYSGAGINKHIDNGSDKKLDIDCGMGNVCIEF
ncbi:MAG: DUF4097 family beta strand repeat protein [Lachnospiraceae bacterium]|nr:DUF4097 family beta strand repeat protein [Lachnospiraceae bacterium]